MDILQEQFAGLIIFFWTLSTHQFICNIEARIFLDKPTVSGQQPVTKFCFPKPNMIKKILVVLNKTYKKACTSNT